MEQTYIFKLTTEEIEILEKASQVLQNIYNEDYKDYINCADYIILNILKNSIDK